MRRSIYNKVLGLYASIEKYEHYHKIPKVRPPPLDLFYTSSPSANISLSQPSAVTKSKMVANYKNMHLRAQNMTVLLPKPLPKIKNTDHLTQAPTNGQPLHECHSPGRNNDMQVCNIFVSQSLLRNSIFC